jgi:hypothetical protein
MQPQTSNDVAAKTDQIEWLIRLLGTSFKRASIKEL